jgi:hypothetical protein
MATIVAGLGAVLHANRGAIPVQDIKDVLSTVERCLALDRLLPSFGNVVTIAGLQVSSEYITTLGQQGLIPFTICRRCCSCSFWDTDRSRKCTSQRPGEDLCDMVFLKWMA